MYHHHIIIFLLTLCAVSCTERIDIHTDDAPPQLIIYGHITTDAMQHAIRVTRSSGYFATGKPEGVSHATVTITGTGGDAFALTESKTEAGLYLTDAGVGGIEGQTYTLNVSLDYDNNGQTEQYTASSYLPHSAQLDSITLRPATVRGKEMVEVHVFGGLSTDKDCYYSFHAFRNDEALTDSLSLFQLSDGKLVGVEDMYDVTCYYLDQTKDKTKLAAGDRVTLRIEALNREYGTFLYNAQNEVWGASPFSGPPANIETNITCTGGKAPVGVAGYFAAYPGVESSTVWK